MPETREGRVKLIQSDVGEYIRRMGKVEVDKLLLSLSKTMGLQPEEVEELLDARYNVNREYISRDRLD